MTYEIVHDFGHTAAILSSTKRNSTDQWQRVSDGILIFDGSTANLSSTNRNSSDRSQRDRAADVIVNDDRMPLRRQWTDDEKRYLEAMYEKHDGIISLEVRRKAVKDLKLDPEKGPQVIRKWIFDEKKRRTIFKVVRFIFKVERYDEKIRRERLHIDRAKRKQGFKA